MRRLLLFISFLVFILCRTVVLGKEIQKLNLNDCISLGIKNSPMIKIYEQDLKKAESAVTKAASALWPSVSLTGGATTMYDYLDPFDQIMAQMDPRLPQPVPEDVTSYTARVNINQVLFSYPVFKSYQIAKLYYGQERFNWQKRREELMLNIVNAYLGALKARHLYQLSLENVNQTEKYLKMTKTKYEVGLVPKADLLRIEVNLATAKNNLSKAEIAAQTSLLALKNMLGIPLHTDVELCDVDLPVLEELPEPPRMLEDALKKRSDYLSGEIIVKLAEINLSLARGSYWPNLFAIASYGQNQVARLNWDNNKWTLSLNLTMNIWDGGKTGASLKEAKASLEQAKLNQEMARQKIEMELIQLYLSRIEILQRLTLNEKAVEQARENLRVAEKSYEAGLVTVIYMIIICGKPVVFCNVIKGERGKWQ